MQARAARARADGEARRRSSRRAGKPRPWASRASTSSAAPPRGRGRRARAPREALTRAPLAARPPARRRRRAAGAPPHAGRDRRRRSWRTRARARGGPPGAARARSRAVTGALRRALQRAAMAARGRWTSRSRSSRPRAVATGGFVDAEGFVRHRAAGTRAHRRGGAEQPRAGRRRLRAADDAADQLVAAARPDGRRASTSAWRAHGAPGHAGSGAARGRLDGESDYGVVGLPSVRRLSARHGDGTTARTSSGAEAPRAEDVQARYEDLYAAWRIQRAPARLLRPDFEKFSGDSSGGFRDVAAHEQFLHARARAAALRRELHAHPELRGLRGGVDVGPADAAVRRDGRPDDGASSARGRGGQFADILGGGDAPEARRSGARGPAAHDPVRSGSKLRADVRRAAHGRGERRTSYKLGARGSSAQCVCGHDGHTAALVLEARALRASAARARPPRRARAAALPARGGGRPARAVATARAARCRCARAAASRRRRRGVRAAQLADGPARRGARAAGS